MATTVNPQDLERSCNDFAFFQDLLRNMRLIDDRVVHALNTKIPTRSFVGEVDAAMECKALYNDLEKAHRQRAELVKSCIVSVSGAVSDLKTRHQGDADNVPLLQKLRKEQWTLRMMQSELNIEEVINDRSTKVFIERCRLHYTPPSESS